MNYIVGDIHGMYSKLKSLISLIIRFDSKPIFIFVGDYINKGSNSKMVLDFLKDLNMSFECIFILGNHELYWINSKFYKHELLSKGGRATLKCFGKKDYAETAEFLMREYPFIFKNFKLYHIKDNYIVTHSGINPKKYNNNLDNMIIDDFLFNRFDFLKTKELYLKKYKLIFGHTAFYSIFYDGFKIGIDTGACYYKQQPLTSFCIETGEFFNSRKSQYNLSYFKQNSSPRIIMK